MLDEDMKEDFDDEIVMRLIEAVDLVGTPMTL